MNRDFEKITIIGLGLMGGSLGAALVRKGFRVRGWDNDPEAINEAYRMGAISEVSESFEAVVRDAGVIFIATPVAFISDTIKRCLPYITLEVIFSDMGSIKEQIITEVFSFLPQTCYFVPGHPMTGSERHGITAADPFLFENAAYIIIEDERTPMKAISRIKEILATTGAHLMNLKAAEHDRIVGIVSHLPHLIAATLSRTAGVEEGNFPGTLNLAAGGFRDTTRVAMGSPKLWEEIINGNRDKILRAIHLFEMELGNLKHNIINDDLQGLLLFLNEARETRAQIPAKNKGFLSLLHEMVVTIEDKPGTIEAVLRFLSKANINIKDIEILRIREGDGGTLRLALEDDHSVGEAIKILKAEGFKAWRR